MSGSSSHDEKSLRRALVAAGQLLERRALVHGTSGNLSVRCGDGLLITPTNSSLGALSTDALSRLDAQGAWLSGDKPSKEWPLHLAAYQERPDVHAVVHLHSTHAAAVSCMAGLDPSNCIPPLTAYFVMRVGQVPLVPYHPPGDPYLGTAIRSVLKQARSALLANHGPVVCGPDLDSAVQAAEELEQTAKLMLLLRQSEVAPLTAEQVAALQRQHDPRPKD